MIVRKIHGVPFLILRRELAADSNASYCAILVRRKARVVVSNLTDWSIDHLQPLVNIE